MSDTGRTIDQIPKGSLDLVDKLSDFDCSRWKSIRLLVMHPIWYWDASRIAKRVMIEQILDHYNKATPPEKLAIETTIKNLASK